MSGWHTFFEHFVKAWTKMLAVKVTSQCQKITLQHTVPQGPAACQYIPVYLAIDSI